MAFGRKRKAQQKAWRLKEMQSPPDNRVTTDVPVGEGEEAEALPIDALAVREATQRLKKYKQGKLHLEKRIVANEEYWKLRQWDYIDQNVGKDNLKINTAWLWNVIASKHADIMAGYPEANIRAKRADDTEEAEKLKSIIPVIQKENNYENTYSDLSDTLLKFGGCCAGVFWDGQLHDGLGDIVVKDIDILELFWESGVDDIQDSREVFKVSYVDNDVLKATYPQLQYSLNGKGLTVTKYRTEDNIDYSNKSCVIDWYYKKALNGGKRILHYCKYVDDIVLFASENEPEKYPNGWYHHGKYPFHIAPLFKIKGNLIGFGYSDIGRGDQNAIDILTSAILSNAVETSLPRYFSRLGGNINEQEFADHRKRIVHVQGTLDEASIREIGSSPLPSFVVNMRDRFIDEMKETLGNRDVSNGGSVSGVTAASAIAAMQEQSGKLSKVHNKTMYNLHEQIVDMEIELIRQFYDVKREFRLTGEMGTDRFVEYDNAGLQPQPQPRIAGIEMGLRLPCFDIEVNSAKQSPYTKLEQNELAIQLYNAGVFSPQNTDMALALLRFMDFDHKDEMMRVVQGNGTLLRKYQQLQKVAFQLAQALGDPVMTEQLAQAILMENGQNAAVPYAAEPDRQAATAEPAHMTKARAQAEQSTQV